MTTLIIGGGIAGLWLCDALRRRGDPVLLVEAAALGAGQTIASQGILHGGVKYALAGAVTPSAANIGEMPGRWRDSLAGAAEPDLREVSVRAGHCHLWQTAGVRSSLGMLGARLALQVTPKALEPGERPVALRSCPGTVARIEEPVLDVSSLLAALRRRNAGHLLQVAAGDGAEFQAAGAGQVRTVLLRSPDRGREWTVPVGSVVLAAGAGNEELRRKAGLGTTVMQRRPLHMVLVRGALPPLFGHCVDGARTRATITTVADRQGRAVWVVGGEIAERGVGMSGTELVHHARGELAEMLPDIGFAGMSWAAYRIDRAERATEEGRRPDDVQIIQEGNLFTVWPTKLALAPRLADRLLPLLPPRAGPVAVPADWPTPAVATAPWEEELAWTDAH